MKHTILGSGGIIGEELHNALKGDFAEIKLVNRSSDGNEAVLLADLMNMKQVIEATKGADIVYLTAGVVYSAEQWENQWPQITQNVVNACAETGAKLVYFDNVYMYGKVEGWMTEDTPYNPVSKKGEVRAKTAEFVLANMKNNNLKSLIARSADFYGKSPMSIPNVMVFDKISNGENPLIILNKDARHSYTYTKDIGKAIALLVNNESSFNQVWHLPTDKNVLSAEKFTEMVADSFGVEVDSFMLTHEVLQSVASGDAFVKEYLEMHYQNEYDYLFDSSKFEKSFQFQPTSYQDGIKSLTAEYK